MLYFTAVETEKELQLSSSPKKASISVFVEMILNPDNMVLERLTPVIFKVEKIRFL